MNALKTGIVIFPDCEDGIAASQMLFVPILLVAPSAVVAMTNLTICL